MSLAPLDPLVIRYVVVLGDRPMEEMSPFQGFSPDWWPVLWSLWGMCLLPASVLEGLGSVEALVSQRMRGLRALEWTPASIDAFEALHRTDLGMFTVAFSGERVVADRIEAWRRREDADLLHVTSSDQPTVLPFTDLDAGRVIEHCRRVFSDRSEELDSERRLVVGPALAGWTPRLPEELAFTAHDNAVTAPNLASLLRAGLAPERIEPLDPEGGAAAYDEAMLASARAVLAARRRVGPGPVDRLAPIQPEVYLAEAAMFRVAYQRSRAWGADTVVANQVLRAMQTQTGFAVHGADVIRAMRDPGPANALVAIRRQEMRTFTAGLALTAAQTGSTVLRLSPAVNRVFPALSAFGRSVRSTSPENVRKTPRLFAKIQEGLAAAMGPARMRFLEEEVRGPIKIVSDAPVEWMPVGPLPLLIRHQCSRLNATPGNLLMGELSRTGIVTVGPDTLRDVLVVSAFKPNDRLRDHLRLAVGAVEPGWRGKVRVRFAEVDSIARFEEELGRFEGSILVFDGHGVLDAGDGVGKLMIAAEALDVWSLRGRVRVPPIVILSACDTQGLDSPSHATVANGFLALGATAIVATLLPVTGWSAGAFVGRLFYRLADYLPAALRERGSVLSWAGVVTGMQRMFLASELLDALVGALEARDTRRYHMQTEVNVAINLGTGDWYAGLTDAIASHRGEARGATEARMAKVIARAEAIRYIQLGHPENILIDDGTVRASIAPSWTPRPGALEEPG